MYLSGWDYEYVLVQKWLYPGQRLTRFSPTPSLPHPPPPPKPHCPGHFPASETQMSLNLEITDSAILVGKWVPEINLPLLFLLFPALGLQLPIPTPNFYAGSGFPNVGVQACVVSSLLTKPFLNPLKFLKFIFLKSYWLLFMALCWKKPVYGICIFLKWRMEVDGYKRPHYFPLPCLTPHITEAHVCILYSQKLLFFIEIHCCG